MTLDEQQPLSWQYILLAIVIALGMALVINAPIPIERGEVRAMPNDLELIEHHTDTNGISVDYPAGWHIIPVEQNYFMLSNYSAVASSAPAGHNQVVFHFIAAPLSAFGLPDTTTADMLMDSLMQRSGRTLSDAAPITIGNYAGYRASFSDSAVARERIVAMPDSTTLIWVEAQTPESSWDNVNDLINRVMESITYTAIQG